MEEVSHGMPYFSHWRRVQMTCKLIECCQFFKDSMANLPVTVEYIKKRLCYGDYKYCKRFRMYKEFCNKNISPELYPIDTEEIQQLLKCLNDKQ